MRTDTVSTATPEYEARWAAQHVEDLAQLLKYFTKPQEWYTGAEACEILPFSRRALPEFIDGSVKRNGRRFYPRAGISKVIIDDVTFSHAHFSDVMIQNPEAMFQMTGSELARFVVEVLRSGVVRRRYPDGQIEINPETGERIGGAAV